MTRNSLGSQSSDPKKHDWIDRIIILFSQLNERQVGLLIVVAAFCILGWLLAGHFNELRIGTSISVGN